MSEETLSKSVAETDKALQDIVELSILFDFYSELLSDHKKEIFREYIMNDLSLGEIAQEAGISRQGVHDIIKRCSSKLREYEEKLGLHRRFEAIKADAKELMKLAAAIRTADEAMREDLSKQIEAVTTELMGKL